MAVSVGLELGTAVVRAVALERQGSGVRLVAAAQANWSGEAQDDLVAALRQLRKNLPITRPVIVGLPTSSSVVTTVHPLIVNREREALAVQFELQQHLPYDVAEAAWHYHWFSLNGERAAAGRRAVSPSVSAGPAVVVAMKRSLLEDRLAACQRAGVAIQAVAVSAIATVNAWLTQAGGVDPARGMLLHIDGSLLEWIVLGPSGLHVFTTFHNVESSSQEQLLAVLKGSWMSLHELFGPRASQGTREAGPTTGGSQTGERVWIFGGPVALNLLAADLKKTLGCPVEVLDPARIVSVESRSSANAQQLIPVFGLALQGLGTAPLPMNLLGDIARARHLKRVRRMAQAACGFFAVLAIVCAANGMTALLRNRQTLLQNLTAQERTYQTLRPEARTLLKKQAKLEKRLQQLQDLVRARARVLQALQGIVEVLPDEIWLTKVDAVKDLSAVPSGTAQAGVTLESVVEGYAKSFDSLTYFMDRLKSTAGWTTVRPLGTTVTADQTTGKEIVAFTVQAQQVAGPQAPATGATPQKTGETPGGSEPGTPSLAGGTTPQPSSSTTPSTASAMGKPAGQPSPQPSGSSTSSKGSPSSTSTVPPRRGTAASAPAPQSQRAGALEGGSQATSKDQSAISGHAQSR